MLTNGSIRRAATIGLAVLLFSGPARVAFAGSFAQREAKATRCPAGKDKAREDTKVCPANKRRPALVLRRACCRNARGRVACRSFGPCPARSPS